VKRVTVGLLALVVGPLAGCVSHGTGAADSMKAVVERQVFEDGKPVFDPSGMVRMERKTITDRDEVAKLVAFFPGVGRGKESAIAGGWRPGYWVKLTRADGGSANVTVNDDATVWSEGHGDWKAQPGLKEHLDRLLAGGGDQAAGKQDTAKK
jgi:hypothetical protein